MKIAGAVLVIIGFIAAMFESIPAIMGGVILIFTGEMLFWKGYVK